MIRISIRNLKPGMRIGYPVVREDGVILLRDGIPLTAQFINRLREMGFEYVYIRDNRCKDYNLEETISHETRRKALQTLHDTFYQTVRGARVSLQTVTRLVDEIIDEIFSVKRSVVSLVQLRQHDDSVFAHSVNVAALSVYLGKFLGMDRKELRILALGAIMHDLGKMKIPAAILNKNGQLNVNEWSDIEKHPAWSAEILLENLPEHDECITIALQHHERLDGSGYPYGLAEEDIHFLSRICACADVYDALTVDRPYRKRFSYAEALEYLMGNAGRLFDVQVVTTMVRHIAPYPVGETVRLSTGEIAVVVRLNEGLPIRPLVRILQDREG
ncbi:MAG TPA: HD-GYP domain-containing protein, partial [Atribacteraceae bacterium]|nr:HD-GYP domain-containing protein [Atribacteraceae bacterium]